MKARQLRIDYYPDMNNGPLQSGEPDIDHCHDQAIEHLNKRQFGPAQQACLKILRDDPNHADAHFLLGMIAIEVGRPVNALEFIEKALQLNSQKAEYHAHHARCLSLLNRNAEALKSAEQAENLMPRSPALWDTLGVVYSRAGQHEGASQAFAQAAELAPDNPTFQFNLGSSLRFLGDIEAASQAYEAAIAISPRYYRAHAALSPLKKQTPESNHIERLEGLLQSVKDNVNGELQLRHALAKELEDLGRYDEAFKHLHAGNARKRATLNYSSKQDQAVFDALRQHFTSASDDKAGYASAEPLFIVGMPRTGTTLIERILSSHSDVTSAGELHNFGMLVKQAAGTTSTATLDTETIRQALRTDPAALGKAYVESTRPLTGHAPHFIDKLPMNFLYIGFIRRALPNARIICVRRNPMDTCLSNYRQLFSLSANSAQYAFDLLDTGRYFILFDQLMAHWKGLFPEHILEVEYESVVTNLAQESLRMTEFCGLNWQEACLTFQNNTAPVATASAVQVREPLYTHAAGRWKHYETHLQELRQLLEAAGVDTGTADIEQTLAHV